MASPADVFEILRSERIGVTSLTNSASRDIIGHVIPRRQFPIGGPLGPSLCSGLRGTYRRTLRSD